MNQPQDYLHIKAWGLLVRSQQWHIDRQQQNAAKDNAPLDALFEGRDGDWVTMAGLMSETAKAEVRSMVKYLREKTVDTQSQTDTIKP